MVLSSFSMSWGDGTESLALCGAVPLLVAAVDDDGGRGAAIGAAAGVGGVHHALTHTYKKCRADIIHNGHRIKFNLYPACSSGLDDPEINQIQMRKRVRKCLEKTSFL